MRDHGSSNGDRTRRQFLATTGAAAVAGLTGCTALTAPSDDFGIGTTAVAFDPPTVTVETGDEAVWHNTSSRGHTVTAYEGTLPKGVASFVSGGYETEQAARNAYPDSLGGLIGSGETYTYSFDVPDGYGYLCIPHGWADMIGAIVAGE